MSALASLLVRDQIVSVRQVEEAISRQVISGGDIETALLEMSAAPENVVTAYRASLMGLPPVTRDQVMEVQPEVLRALPREVAVKHRLVPLAVDGRRLWVASAQPLPREALEQIGFLLGCEVAVRIACEVRIAAALHRHYELKPSSRLARIAEKLDRMPPGDLPALASAGGVTPKTLPPPGPESDGPRTDRFGFALSPPEAAPKSTRPRAVTARGVGIARVIGVGDPKPKRISSPAVPPPEPQVAAAVAVRPKTPVVPAAPAAPASTEAGVGVPAVSLREAIERLAAAEDRDAILDVLLGFSRSLFDVGVLFVTHEDVAEGKEAFGAGIDVEAVRRLAVPLDVPSAFADVRATGAPRRLRRGGTSIDETFLESLGRTAARPFVLIPIFVRDRLILVLYGDRGGQHLGLDDIAELLALVPQVGDAFERLIVERKRRARQSAGAPVSLPPDDGRENSPSVPVVVGTSVPSSTTEKASVESSVSSYSGDEDSPRPSRLRGDPSASEALSILGVPRSAPPPPGATPAAAPIAAPPDDDDDVTIEVGEVDGQAAVEIEEAVALEREKAREVRRDDKVGRYSYVSDRPGPRRTSERPPSRVESTRPPRPRSEPPVARTPAAETPTPRARPSDRPGPKRPDPRRENGAVPDREVVDVAMHSGEVLIARTANAGPEPSVIVDMGGSIEKLVHDLVRCAPDEEGPALTAVLSAGEATLPVLVQHFPGPLWFDRSRPYRKLPRGRDVSAIARALVAFRARAVPYVRSLIDAKDANVRFYALLVATELPPIEFGEAIARRMFDADPGIRALAYELLRPLVAEASHENTILKPLRVEARAPRRDVRRRCLSIQALGELRDVASLPLLVGILADDEPDVVEAAHAALVELTRQDFGTSERRWSQWSEKNAGRHRIEWLIESLMHASEAIRTAAGEELQQLTQEYRGYHPSLGKRQRESIQKKYLEWWESEGRSRLRR